MIQRYVLLSSVAAVGVLAGCVQPPEGYVGPTDTFSPDSGSFVGIVDGGRLVDGGGVVSKPARLDAVLVADRPPPALSGGTLSVSADGAVAVAADPDRDAVYVVALSSGAVRTLSLAQGSEPGRVVLDDAGHAHVVLRGAGKIAQVDLATGTLQRETAVCKLPRGIAHDARAGALWVACASGELVSLGAVDHAERVRKFVALDLRDVMVSPAGERFVSRYRSAQLLRVDAQGALLDAHQPPVTEGFGIRGVVARAPTLAWRTLIDTEGKPLMLHQSSQIDEVPLDAPGGYGGGCQTITQAAVTRYDEHGDPGVVFSLFNPGLSVDVALSPDGQTLATAAPGAYLRGERGSLQLISLSALVPVQSAKRLDKSVDAGFPAPVGLDGGVALPGTDAGAAGCAHGFPLDQAHDVQVTAVAFAGKDLLAFSREPARLRRYAVEAREGIPFVELQLDLPLAETSVRDTGHELFHADVGSGLACASCHGEALDDGHVWTFSGFGARRTQTMRGGMLSTLPLHWEGDMPTFQHLVDEVMTRRMGGFPVEGQYADALANWLDAQPELALDATDAAAKLRGQALFESAEVGCATCHAGPMLTNNGSSNVGTGQVFQVPSLRGLALRAPYMHDGCAPTLHDRFAARCGGGDQHGKTSQLSAPQIDDLVAYLLTL